MADEGSGGEEHFARFTLNGDRFADARLPIDALIELQRYRDMVLEASRQAWFAVHAGEPIPDDFDQKFDLAISDVEPGSATPVMDKPRSEYDEYYESGRDELEAAFAEIVNAGFKGVALLESPEAQHPEEGEDEEPQRELRRLQLPPKLAPLANLVDLPAFNEFGSSLMPGEALRFEATPEHDEVVVTSSTPNSVFQPFVELIETLRTPRLPPTEDVKQSETRLVTRSV